MLAHSSPRHRHIHALFGELLHRIDAHGNSWRCSCGLFLQSAPGRCVAPPAHVIARAATRWLARRGALKRPFRTVTITIAALHKSYNGAMSHGAQRIRGMRQAAGLTVSQRRPPNVIDRVVHVRAMRVGDHSTVCNDGRPSRPRLPGTRTSRGVNGVAPAPGAPGRGG
jgi:hypothetical protein